MAFQDPPTNTPMVDKSGSISTPWRFWFQEFSRRAAKVDQDGLTASQVLYTDSDGNITSTGTLDSASTTSEGTVELATGAETVAQTADDKAVTPEALAFWRCEGTPASAAASGTKGQIRVDTDYAYFCVATDTWLRVGIATW